MPWYSLQTKPNYEAKVIEHIMNRKSERNLAEIREIFAPEDILIEYKDGVKKERKRKLYPNYIFIEMDYSDKIWHALKDLGAKNGIVGFLGSSNGGKPKEVPQKDIDIMKAQVSTVDAPKHKVSFEVNAKVRITTGSFADFYGVVQSVDYEKSKAKVAINVFQRDTIVDMDLNGLELAPE